MSANETVANPVAFELPSQALDMTDLFWIHPKTIQGIDGLINSTRLSTMSLAVGTHAESSVAARTQLSEVFIDADDPMKVELQRALDIGFMYGSLAATETVGTTESATLADDKPLPKALISGFKSCLKGLDVENNEDNYRLFMRLREIEVEHAHSDVLAFGLMTTQDHMARQFGENHDAPDELSVEQTRRLQSMYYAGALAGALLSSDRSMLNKPPVEIMRSAQAGGESITMRVEFEAGDDLVSSIDYLLGTKLTFDYHNPEGADRPYITAMSTGIQYGPNVISKPIPVPNAHDTTFMKSVYLDEVDALIFADSDSGKISIEAMTEDSISSIEKHDNIVGMVADNMCVGAYDAAHPNAAVLCELVSKMYGVDLSDVPYANGLTSTSMEAYDDPIPVNKLGWMALASVAAVWAPDAFGKAVDIAEVHWTIDSAASALVLATYALAYVLTRKLRSGEMRMDDVLRQALDRTTLHR